MSKPGMWFAVLAPAVLSLAAEAVPSAEAPGAGAADLPVNRWTTLYDGPAVTYNNNKVHWILEMNRAVLWTVGPGMVGEESLSAFSVAEKAWSSKKALLPAGCAMGRDTGYVNYWSASSSVYLPGLRQILLLNPAGDPKATRWVPTNTWLIDPQSGACTAAGEVRMADDPEKFGYPESSNPARGTGLPAPQWGAMVYDSARKEALAFGGGACWGRVGDAAEPVKSGDWIYDETRKRIRRVTPDDAGNLQARRWFPAHCGTWTFSEASKKWAPIAQPLGQQPSGRLKPALAFDPESQRAVLFGGDDDTRCLNDTWIYDSRTRAWSEIKPATVPPPRASAAMVYLPDQKAILLAGGYSGGGVPLNDVWIFSLADNNWRRLGLDLPAATVNCSACYDTENRAVLLFASDFQGGRPGRKEAVHALRLDLATAPLGKAAPADPDSAYHCKNYWLEAQRTWLPDEWLSGPGAPEDEQAVRARLAALPANTWKLLNPPRKAPARVWGIHTYDPRTHKAFAYGGSHGGYDGMEVNTYDLLTNRWRAMADGTPHRPPWAYKSGGGVSGLSFSGCHMLGTHNRKSIGVDPESGCMLNVKGDVYEPRSHLYVGSIGTCPGTWSASTQPAYVTAPHGLYAYTAKGSAASLFRADVTAGKWETVAEGTGPAHAEANHVCYDAKRDRLVYFDAKSAAISTFEFKTKQWQQEKPDGKAPACATACSAYVEPLDAAVLFFPESKDAPQRLYCYKLAEKKWYAASLAGDQIRFDSLSNSISYDPELNLLVRVTQADRGGSVEILVLRLDAAALKLEALK